MQHMRQCNTCANATLAPMQHLRQCNTCVNATDAPMQHSYYREMGLLAGIYALLLISLTACSALQYSALRFNRLHYWVLLQPSKRGKLSCDVANIVLTKGGGGAAGFAAKTHHFSDPISPPTAAGRRGGAAAAADF